MTQHTLTARIALILALAAVSLAAQSGGGASTGLLNVYQYSSYFLDRDKKLDLDYELAVEDNDYYDNVAKLGGSQTLVDTPLEIALLSYSAGVVDVRPAKAVEMLPANNSRLADLKLGTATYMDIQVARFTGSDPAPYAAALKFITDRGKVSEADIKKFMRDGIRSALTTEMSKNNRGFVPIEAFNEWKSKGYGDFIGTATDVLVAFFENPMQRNYETVRGMVARQLNLVGDGDILASYASADALMNAINYVNLDLGNKLNIEVSPTTQPAFAKAPNDQRLNVFSIPYTVGRGR